MGKYALDAFERYPLVKLRPGMGRPRNRSFRLIVWEPGGQIPMEPGTDAILRLDLAENLPAARDAICRAGEMLAGKLAGVVLACGSCTGATLAELLQLYHQSFGQTPLLVEPGTELAELCRREGLTFGLWLPLEAGILPLRRRIAQSGLSRQWERGPVYLQAGGPLTSAELDAARRWHASGADVPAPLGAWMTLRRMMFPRDLTAGGPMPLRMWWQNLGTAPCYGEIRVVLELRREGERLPIELAESRIRPGLGDCTLNTTGGVPAEARGCFALWCGLAAGEEMLPLAMEGPESTGMYHVGQLTLDDVARPHLQTMWEEQYADGYYPLEDPAQPE